MEMIDLMLNFTIDIDVFVGLFLLLDFFEPLANSLRILKLGFSWEHFKVFEDY